MDAEPTSPEIDRAGRAGTAGGAGDTGRAALIDQNLTRTDPLVDRRARAGAGSRWARLRHRVRGRPVLGRLYRAGVGVVGAGIVVAGLLLVPLPGPGWLIVFAGLGVLATEFAWAARVLALARRIWRRWARWVLGRSLVTRGLLGLAGCLVVVGVAAVYLRWQGVPAWLPFTD